MKPDLHRFPLLVAWEMTRACLLACLHCRASAVPDPLPGELTTEEGLRLLRELSTYTPKPILLPTGGDPLARPDLFLLLEEAQRLGIKVGITPAVTPRLTREVVARFRELGIHQMAISLDGASPEAHDGFRGVPGTFALALKALTWAKEVGLMTQVNTTVTRRTAKELPGIAKILSEKGVATWEVFFLVPVGRGALLEQLSPEEYEAAMQLLFDLSRQYPFKVRTTEGPMFRRWPWNAAGPRAERTGPWWAKAGGSTSPTASVSSSSPPRERSTPRASCPSLRGTYARNPSWRFTGTAPFSSSSVTGHS